MAVKIRMKKMGRKGRPFFRICASDVRFPRDGRVIEELGSYDPSVPETDARVVLNNDRINYWLSVGAKASPKVAVLIKKYGAEGTHLEEQKSAIGRLGERRAKAVASAIAAAAAIPVPVAAEPVSETPAESSETENTAEAVASEATAEE